MLLIKSFSCNKTQAHKSKVCKVREFLRCHCKKIHTECAKLANEITINSFVVNCVLAIPGFGGYGLFKHSRNRMRKENFRERLHIIAYTEKDGLKFIWNKRTFSLNFVHFLWTKH